MQRANVCCLSPRSRRAVVRASISVRRRLANEIEIEIGERALSWVGGGVSEIAIHELNLKSLLCRKRRTIIRRCAMLLFRNVYTSDVDPAENRRAAALQAVMYLDAEVPIALN